MVKFLENLQEAEKIIRVVDKLIYSEIPVAKGKNIILKFLEELNLALTKCIESVLYYEYFTNKITLSSDKKTNLKTFMDHCASDYNITPEEKRKILQLFNLAKTHQQSPFEFKKGEKIIILSQTSTPSFFDIEIAKEFLELGKNILNKIFTKIHQRGKTPRAFTGGY